VFESGSAKTVLGAAVLLAALAVFAVEQVAIYRVNGWWLDELFSFWASDPQLRFWDIFSSRIVTDSNPPLYFAALYWVRAAFSSDMVASYVLNATVLAGACAVVLLMSSRAGLLLAGIAGCSLFLIGGPALRYMPETRSYFMALACVFAASWYAALMIVQRAWRPPLSVPVLIGVAAALAHLFAALSCGALAAGLLLAALIARDGRLARDALALGLATALASLAWLLVARGATGNVSWIEFTPQAVTVAAWEVKQLAFGSRIAVASFVALLAAGFVFARTRMLAAVFAVAFALFSLLPVLASLKLPIITGRYWMIGAPLLVTLPVFLSVEWQRENAPSRRGLLLAAHGLTALFFILSSVGGFASALEFTAMKPIWKGAGTVAPLLGRCPSHSVHVLGPARYYSIISGANEDVFLEADSTAARGGEAQCPVLGWAEHVRQGDRFVVEASDQQLLQLLQLHVDPGQYEIRRHDSGYVVLRKIP